MRYWWQNVDTASIMLSNEFGRNQCTMAFHGKKTSNFENRLIILQSQLIFFSGQNTILYIHKYIKYTR